jgi:hypothetical protein
MKSLLKHPLLLLFAMVFIFGGTALANNSIDHPDNMWRPVNKKGKYAKLDVSSLPMEKEVTVRVRNSSDLLIDEFKVRNTGQQYVLLNLNRLNPGLYSLNLIRGEKDVVRKVINVNWDKVRMANIVNLSRDSGLEDRWPLSHIR